MHLLFQAILISSSKDENDKSRHICTVIIKVLTWHCLQLITWLARRDEKKRSDRVIPIPVGNPPMLLNSSELCLSNRHKCYFFYMVVYHCLKIKQVCAWRKDKDLHAVKPNETESNSNWFQCILIRVLCSNMFIFMVHQEAVWG